MGFKFLCCMITIILPRKSRILHRKHHMGVNEDSSKPFEKCFLFLVRLSTRTRMKTLAKHLRISVLLFWGVWQTISWTLFLQQSLYEGNSEMVLISHWGRKKALWLQTLSTTYNNWRWQGTWIGTFSVSGHRSSISRAYLCPSKHVPGARSRDISAKGASSSPVVPSLSPVQGKTTA